MPAGQPPETVAAIDCGSSAIRASIAEVRGKGGWRLLDECAREVDLQHALHLGRFRRRAMDEVIAALHDILQIIAGYGVSRIRAVGTSAWREAGNRDTLLERVLDSCGIEIEVIDGAELARLYFEALQQVLQREHRTLSGNTVLADLGSGATVLGLIQRGKLTRAVEERFGTMRLLHEFSSLRDSLDFEHAIGRFAHGAAAMMVRRLQVGSFKHLVVTGTEIRELAARIRPDSKGLITELRQADVKAWLEPCAGHSIRSIAERLDLPVEEAAGLLMGAALMTHLCDETGCGLIQVPLLHLREGLLADFLPGALGPHHLSRTNLLAMAKQMAKRFGTNAAYAENTRSLARQLFDQLQEVHHLTSRDRTLLEMAALMHDIGAYVNARSRHKHSYYLIRSADFAGVSEVEHEIVALVARYHRRSPPKQEHEAFLALPRRARVVVRQLAAILRLAYALDVERTQRIREVDCRLDGDRLILRVDRRQITLEAWSIADKSGMFTDVFGLDVALVPREA